MMIITIYFTSGRYVKYRTEKYKNLIEWWDSVDLLKPTSFVMINETIINKDSIERVFREDE